MFHFKSAAKHSFVLPNKHTDFFYSRLHLVKEPGYSGVNMYPSSEWTLDFGCTYPKFVS